MKSAQTAECGPLGLSTCYSNIASSHTEVRGRYVHTVRPTLSHYIIITHLFLSQLLPTCMSAASGKMARTLDNSVTIT